MELKNVAINVNDGVPVREEIKFSTGNLTPGKVLGIPAVQADRAIKQGLVVECDEVQATTDENPNDLPPKPAAKPKSKGKKPVAVVEDPLS